MNRLLSLLLAAAILIPAAYAQQRSPASEPYTFERPATDPSSSSAVPPDYEHLLTEDAPHRYRYDTATGRPSLTPEARAEAERLAAGRREATLAEIARLPRTERTRPGGSEGILRSGAIVFTVNSAYDNPDSVPGDGFCATSFSECTLRAAIQEAVQQPDTQPVRIEFDITLGPFPTSFGAWTIPVNYDDGTGANGRLPFADQPNLVIDGLTQGDASCYFNLYLGPTHNLNVVLDGSLTMTGNGLDSITPDFGARGLVIQNFGFGYGVSATGVGSLAECDYIGTDEIGELDEGNLDGALVNGFVYTSLVSGNDGNGVVMAFDGSTVSNSVIGLDENSEAALGNDNSGILIFADDARVLSTRIGANGLDGITLTSLLGAAAERAVIGPSGGLTNTIGLGAFDRALGNGRYGIWITGGASDNDIGEPDDIFSSNLIGSNFGAGIVVDGTGTNNNRIRNNIVGFDGNFSSPEARPNFQGIVVFDNFGSGAPSGTIIGGSDEDDGNIFSGNANYGVYLEVDANTVIRNNIVGLDRNGDALGNMQGGINLDGSSNPVVRDNVVSGNIGTGISAIELFALSGTTGGAMIRDNRVGTNDAGSAARSNGLSGIAILDAESTTIRGNTISANADAGIFLDEGTDDVVIRDNRIGTQSNGSGDLGNGLAGILCHDASDVRIGGTTHADRNKIARNGGDGVFLADDCTRVAVLRNEIVNNGGLGIDLAPNGVNPNDAGDTDGGANQGTNFPVITSAINDGTNAVVTVTLNARPNQAYRIELFRTGAADASGFGEGSTFIANRDPSTNGSGTLTTTFTRPASDFQVGKWATATATPINGATFTGFTGTSEFSRAVQVEAPSGPPLTVTITPTSSVVLERGDRAFFDITFDVGATGPSSFEFWTEAVLPGGGVRTPLIGPNTVNVTPPATVTLSFSQQVPGVAPFGSYTYRVKAGSFPSSVEDQDSFAAQVVPGREAGPEDWQAFDAEGTLLDGPQTYDFRTATEESAAASSEALPSEATLTGAYPNPFSGRATVAFALPSSQRVTLTVYDVLGREVAVLADGEVEAGRHTATLDGSALPSGVYLVRLGTGATVQTQRVTLVQ